MDSVPIATDGFFEQDHSLRSFQKGVFAARSRAHLGVSCGIRIRRFRADQPTAPETVPNENPTQELRLTRSFKRSWQLGSQSPLPASAWLSIELPTCRDLAAGFGWNPRRIRSGGESCSRVAGDDHSVSQCDNASSQHNEDACFDPLEGPESVGRLICEQQVEAVVSKTGIRDAWTTRSWSLR